MKRREIVALLASSMLIFECFLAIPVLASESGSKVTVYFHEDYEDYLLLSGSYGHLNESFPVKENISDAVVGTFNLSDISQIDGDVDFDLYFSLPIAVSNITSLLDELLSAAVDIYSNSNSTGNLSETFQSIFEGLTNISWSNFTLNIADMTLSGEENFTLYVMDDDSTIAEREITVKRKIINENANISTLIDSILENLTTFNYVGLLNIWEQLTQNVQHITVSLHNISYYGDELTFMIEAENEMANVREILQQLGEINETALIDILKTIGYYSDTNLSESQIKNIKAVINIFNFIRPLLEKLLNVSFVYDSIEYPSSITFDGKLVERREIGKRRYFLRDLTVDSSNKKVLSKNPPLYSNTSEVRISGSGEQWVVYPSYNHVTRVVGDADVVLYMKYPEVADLLTNLSLGSLLSFIYVIEASLLDVDKDGNVVKEIASGTKTVNVVLSRSLTQIEVKDIDYVLEKNHALALKVSVSSRFLQSSRFNNISIANFSLSDLINLLDLLGIEFDLGNLIGIEEPTLMYNSYNTSSHVDVTLTLPTDIKLEFKNGVSSKQRILKSGRAIYNITVRNQGNKSDTVNLTVYVIDTNYMVTPEGWTYFLNGTDGGTATYSQYGIRYISDSISLSGGQNKDITVTVTPSPNGKYGDSAKLYISADGERGRDSLEGMVILSPEKRRFLIDISSIPGKDVRKGSSYTYLFIIKNAGNDVEDLVISVESQNGWDFVLDTSSIRLNPGEEKEVNVTVTVPQNVETGSQDILVFTVYSADHLSNRNTVMVVTTAVVPTVAQVITESFDSFAQTMGLTAVFGSAAGMILLTIVIAIILLIIVFIIRHILRKHVLLICFDRIKEVDVDGEEKFEIVVRNPTKWRKVYDLSINKESLPEGWDVSISDEEIKLNPGEEHKIYVSVRASPDVGPDGYAEIKVTAVPRDRPAKRSTISLLAMVKGAQIKLGIANVFHWPRIFKEGEIVTTRFSVKNEGNVTAKNLSIVLSVNGIEKNRVDNISIPAGGYADVKMPWRAFQGKNNVYIRVIRQ